MSEYTGDVEFIQFLKSISLFVTDDNSASIGAQMSQMSGTTE